MKRQCGSVANKRERFYKTGNLGSSGRTKGVDGLHARGIILFSGSLYVLAITGIKFIGIITPIGGMSFLIAWGLVIWTAVTH